METNRLKQFRTIVETGNLRRAADLLGISHGGLSKSMKVLQEELGFSIFHPSGRGLVVTDEGMRLYDKSETFFESLDGLLGHARGRSSNVVRIGSFEVFTSYFAGPLVKHYLADPEIEIHELVPGRLEEALAYEKIDIGITYEPIPRKGIEYVKVATLFMSAYALKDRFSGTPLSEIPFVVPVSPLEGAPSGVKGRDGWPDEKLKRLIRYRVDLMSTGLELVRQGLAAIFIPRFVAKLHNQNSAGDRQIEALSLPKTVANIKRDIFVVKRESTAENKVIQRIAKALRDL